MAELTGKPMNVIVNWFTLLIVFVFDPLAIMVIALNKLIGRNKNGNHGDNDVDSNDTDSIDDRDINNSTPVLSENDGDEVSQREEPLGTSGEEDQEEEVEEVLEVPQDKEEDRIRGFKLPDEARGFHHLKKIKEFFMVKNR